MQKYQHVELPRVNYRLTNRTISDLHKLAYGITRRYSSNQAKGAIKLNNQSVEIIYQRLELIGQSGDWIK